MRFLSAETSHALTRKIILPLAALAAGLLLFAIGGIFWIADYQTEVAIKQQARLANGALRIQSERLATSASDYGYWDDAVTAIVDKPDPAWMNENIGAGAQKSLGVEMAYALDPQGNAVYSYVAGTDGREAPDKRLGDAFRQAFDAWKKGPADKTYSGLLAHDGRAMVMAIAPIRSFTHAERKPTGFSLVFVKLIDFELLRQVAHDFELANFRAVSVDAKVADPLATVTIGDGWHGNIARFTWDPQRPGSDLLNIALPFMTLFLLILVLLAGFVLNYVIASAQLLSDRERRATYDPLTGLANRERFFGELDVAMNRIRPGVTGVAVMYIDLDGFKSINDTMGHAAGDELLSQAAGRFKTCVRDIDLVARLGGDEFAIILSGKCDRSQVQAIGARILLAMAEPFHLTAGKAHASCSIGIADCFDKKISGTDLLDLADHALYRAKAAGKNAMHFASDAHAAEADLKVA